MTCAATSSSTCLSCAPGGPSLPLVPAVAETGSPDWTDPHVIDHAPDIKDDLREMDCGEKTRDSKLSEIGILPALGVCVPACYCHERNLWSSCVYENAVSEFPSCYSVFIVFSSV